MESGSADGRELAQWRGQGRRPWPGRKRWRHPRSFGRACACRGTPAPTSFLSFFTSSGVLVVSGNARLGSQGWRGINLRILRWPIEMILLVGSPPLQGRSAMRGEDTARVGRRMALRRFYSPANDAIAQQVRTDRRRTWMVSGFGSDIYTFVEYFLPISIVLVGKTRILSDPNPEKGIYKKYLEWFQIFERKNNMN